VQKLEMTPRPETEVRAVVVQLYEEHRSHVYQYLLTFGLNSGQAVDVTQEAFLRLFEVLRKGREIENPKAWIYAVAHNAAVNARAANSRIRELTDQDIAQRADVGPSPEQALLKAETLRVLRHEIGKLNERQRECLYLRMEGFRLRDIAEITGSQLSAVAKTVQRAIAQIRKALYD
jgi:RNA polymerase sigma-70 factor, ECF subfamily